MQEIRASRYLGLAIRASEVVYGLDNIKQKKHKIKMLLCCKSASKNLFEEIVFIAEKNNIPFYQFTEHTIDELVKTDNCKVIGIENPNLAEQIKLVLEGSR